jgi:hypothetical protein
LLTSFFLTTFFSWICLLLLCFHSFSSFWWITLKFITLKLEEVHNVAKKMSSIVSMC